MRIVNKVASFLLILLSVFLLLSCNLKSYSKEKTVVTVMGYGSENNSEGKSFLRIVSEYEKLNPNVTIKYTLKHDADYHQKVKSRIIAGNIPDIAYMGSDARWGKPWNEAGLQIDMKPYLDPKQYDYNLISYDNDKNEILYIPLGTANICTVLFVNEKLLNELGLALPKTYEDLQKMVIPAKKRGIEVLGTHGLDNWVWGSCFLSTFIARTSGDPKWIEKALTGETHFTDKEFINALNIITKMVDDGIMSKNSVLIDSQQGIDKFNKGEYLIYVSGQWDAANISEELQPYTKLLPFPKLPYEKGCENTVAATKQSGYGLTRFALANKKELQASIDFLNYFYNETETLTRLTNGEIVAPILTDFEIPDDVSPIVKAKATLGMTSSITDVIDSFLTGNPNTVLCDGIQSLITKRITASNLATNVENMVR